MEHVTHYKVKVFQMEENNVGTGKIIWEGTAPIRSDGRFTNSFAERCEKRAERVNRIIRVEVQDPRSRYALYFYTGKIGGLTHILPGLKGFAITGGYVFFDYRRKKRRGRFIGYMNEGHGFYFTKDIYQNIIFKEEKHPKLNSISEAIDWLMDNAIGWKSY